MMERNRGRADSFLEGLCLYRGFVFALFVISLVLMVLSLGSFVVVEPGTATYVVVVLNMLGLGVFMLVTGTILFLCRDKEY